ncbi:transposase family protein [Streptomyces sp. NPDC050388]|uniref:transposase family protein n=1 Tax=Streptomyces sp. NPDC050388 TaxID=3155781 RepID=UPI00341217ED
MAEVPDPRDPRGVRHAPVVVLALTACAVPAGAPSLPAVGEGKRRPVHLRVIRAVQPLPGPSPGGRAGRDPARPASEVRRGGRPRWRRVRLPGGGGRSR